MGINPKHSIFSGLEKSALLLPGTSRFSFWASSFHLHLPNEQGIYASCLKSKALKSKLIKTFPGQAILELTTCSKSKMEVMLFLALFS